MKRLFERMLSPLLWVALTVTLAWLTAVGTALFLPPLAKTECRGGTAPAHHTYRFADAFGLKAPAAAPARPVKKPVRRVSLRGYELTMTAVGNPSMAMILHNGKSKLLAVGDTIDGFRLEKVYTDRVELSRNGTQYWLSMKKKGKRTYRAAPSAAKPARPSAYAEQIRHEGDTYYIPRELLDEFHDVRKIFKYIAIKPIYKDNRLVGFGVSNVKKGSVFDKMGLRKRDIITKINGEALTSETQAFKYFNKINELSSLTMTIKRGREEKELHYEIF